MGPAAEKITILHFNDVYNIEERSEEPVGGAARMKTALKQYTDKNPLILFSGDALAPSIREYQKAADSDCPPPLSFVNF